MSEEIKVSVNSWGAGRSLTLSWIDPITGKRKTQSAKTRDWRTAERMAGKLAEELEAGTVSPSRVTWDEFQKRYDAEKLATLAPKTRETALASLRHVKRVLSIEHLGKLSASALSKFAAECRKQGMKDTTLAHHLRHIKAACRWGAKLGLMAKAPAVEMPKRSKGSQARSRAITTEEYERAIVAIPKARPHDAAQWERYITGLWLSGLRRSEAMALTWDADGVFCVHLGEKRPVFVIRSEGQKSGKAETCPMAPDFALGCWRSPKLSGRVRFSGWSMPERISHFVKTGWGESWKASAARLASRWGPGRRRARTARQPRSPSSRVAIPTAVGSVRSGRGGFRLQC